MHPTCAGCRAAPDIGKGFSTLTSGSSGWHLVQTSPADSSTGVNTAANASGNATLSWWCPKCWRKRRASLRASA